MIISQWPRVTGLSLSLSLSVCLSLSLSLSRSLSLTLSLYTSWKHQKISSFLFIKTATWSCSVKKVFLEILQNSQENTCARVSFLIKLQAGLQKKETLAQVFSCEFCEIFKNNFGRSLLRLVIEGFKNGHIKFEWTKTALCFFLTKENIWKSTMIVLMNFIPEFLITVI